MLGKKDLCYPEFLECCKFATDPYWKSIFEDLSYGICPYSTYIYKDILYCNSPGKEFNYRIKNSSNISTLYSDIYFLFTKKLGLYSKEEKLKKFIDLEDFRKKYEFEDWSDIKKKNLKSFLIENFVIDLKNKYSLSIADTKKILSILTIMIIFRMLGNSDIIIEKGKIVEITKVCCNKEESYISVISNEIIKESRFYEEKPISKKRSLKEEWNKYICYLEKF